MKRQEIYEGHEYATDKNWKITFGDDDKETQFGVYIETINMSDMTSEPEYEQYPYLVSFEIVADKPHTSFYEGDGKPSKLSLLADVKSYMGGVPVDHILVNGTRSCAEQGDDAFGAVVAQFTPKEAKVVTSKANFGTYAAQNGKGSEFQYLQFKTEAAAAKYVDYILKHRVGCLNILIGFILDRPINMMGETGWSLIEHQVLGKAKKHSGGAK